MDYLIFYRFAIINHFFNFMFIVIVKVMISTSNPCLARQCWDKLPKYILKIRNCSYVTRAISKFSKITRVIYIKNRLKQTC